MFSKISFGRKGAGLIACFFLAFTTPARASDQLWIFEPELERIYQLVLNLQTEQAYSALAKINTKTNVFHKIYVQSFCETLDVLITEDEKRFEQVDLLFKERIKYLQGLPEGPEMLFLQAELELQRGFNLINLNQEISAVFAIRTAYNRTQECMKKYPDFVPIKKTSGVIQVMIGSIPDKFHWFMSLLGLKGSVALGQKQLNELRNSKSSLSTEASILYFTIKGFINQQFDEASRGIAEALRQQPDSRLLMFLAVNMMMKNSQGEAALHVIQELDQHKEGLQMHYIEYLRGEALLQRGEYLPAIEAYQYFIKQYKSKSFKKDAYFKISLCYYLMGKMDLAKSNFEIARKTGKDVAEPDKYAAAQLAENVFPNAKILRVRFYTDGGYYKQAKEVLNSVVPHDLATAKDQTEFYYRKARLSHKTGELSAAKLFYSQTIDMTGQKPWYFAPNSALQLGYIAQAQKDIPTAKKYFEMALSYKRHEYKNSIDGKAKSALEQLKN